MEKWETPSIEVLNIEETFGGNLFTGKSDATWTDNVDGWNDLTGKQS